MRARELNLFGKIIGDSFFTNLTPESFNDPEFDKISHVEEGITRYGFFQLMGSYPERKIEKMFEALGYDSSLQSIKSRVFVITFHSTEEIRVKIGNAVKTDINEKAANLVMADYLDKMGAKRAKEDSNVIVFRKYHEKCYGNTFGVVNKTGKNVAVTIDISGSSNSLYAPTSGVHTEIVSPHSVKYLGGSIVHPKAESFTTSYNFSSKRL